MKYIIKLETSNKQPEFMAGFTMRNCLKCSVGLNRMKELQVRVRERKIHE